MDFSEPEHVVQLRAVLRRFIEREMPRAAARQWDEDNHFPREVYDRLARLGVMGLAIPEDYGGPGRDILATMVTIEELASRSFAVAVPYIMSACYAGMNLVECGSEEQKRQMLPRVAEGKLIFAYGWTEPDVGADIASVRTRAERRADSVVVNGAKRFCSGAEICDYIYCLVRTGPEGERHRNLSVILVPPTAAGVTIRRIGSLGMKGAATTDVVFEDVAVPADHILGGEAGWNNGWAMVAGSGLDVERLEVAALAVGVAQAALDDAWAYSTERHQFGKPISSYQSIRHKLADLKTDLHAARLVLYQAAWLANERRPCAIESSMAKLFASEAAKRIALECQTIVGAYGYAKGLDIERYVRDALLLPIIGGSSAIQRNNIARWSGLDRL